MFKLSTMWTTCLHHTLLFAYRSCCKRMRICQYTQGLVFFFFAWGHAAKMLVLSGSDQAAHVRRISHTSQKYVQRGFLPLKLPLFLFYYVTANLPSWLEAGKHSPWWKPCTPAQNLWLWLLKGKALSCSKAVISLLKSCIV
jgi:hypothetical protein